ncbi:MAG: protoporphyrinogen oxidase HemJ [Pseudomonadota bacterium]
MLWVKAFHLIAVISWFAGLLYLPRLFVHHAMTPASDRPTHERFKIMERKLYIMTCIGGTATIVLGFWLLALLPAYAQSGWLQIKLLLVAALVVYHFWCGRLVKVFATDSNTRSHVWYRYFNEAPTLALIAIVVLAVVKPF